MNKLTAAALLLLYLGAMRPVEAAQPKPTKGNTITVANSLSKHCHAIYLGGNDKRLLAVVLGDEIRVTKYRHEKGKMSDLAWDEWCKSIVRGVFDCVNPLDLDEGKTTAEKATAGKATDVSSSAQRPPAKLADTAGQVLLTIIVNSSQHCDVLLRSMQLPNSAVVYKQTDHLPLEAKKFWQFVEPCLLQLNGSPLLEFPSPVKAASFDLLISIDEKYCPRYKVFGTSNLIVRLANGRTTAGKEATPACDGHVSYCY
jgi:hypothetical protein